MKKFILFFRGGTAGEDWSSWITALKRNGNFIDGAPLVKDGKIVRDETIEDFVFDISENARAFLTIQAKDMEDAIAISKNCPVFANGGNVTIRPIEEMF